ncbi:MAG: putative MarR family transcriptional regulator [Friedmanniella sp.]|nr:putative MarR family transcriptional regulator [Friedmanniella sp.]
MDDRLHSLGEDLITTAARVVRWVPKSETMEVSLSAARILARLSDNGPTRISDLASAERCSQPTITNHVKRLEAAGMVSRTSDPNDARSWKIALTDRGLDELKATKVALGTNLEPYLARLPEADLAALRAGVEVMRRLMEIPSPTGR